MTNLVDILSTLRDKSAICSDGSIGTIFHDTEISNMIDQLNTILTTSRLNKTNRDTVSSLITTMTSQKTIREHIQINDIKDYFNRKMYGKLSDFDKEVFKNEALQYYYDYLVTMTPTKIAILQRSKQTRTIFVYDDNFIFKINLDAKNRWRYNSGGYNTEYNKFVKSFSIYDIDASQTRKYLFSFNSNNSSLFQHMSKTVMLKTAERFVSKVRKNIDIKNLSTMNVKRTPEIDKIFSTLNEVDDEYVFFQYGTKVKCSSDYMLVTLKLIK